MLDATIHNGEKLKQLVDLLNSAIRNDEQQEELQWDSKLNNEEKLSIAALSNSDFAGNSNKEEFAVLLEATQELVFHVLPSDTSLAWRSGC